MKNDKDKLYSLKEAAEILDLTERGVERRAEVGRIKCERRDGAEYWFSMGELKAYKRSKWGWKRAMTATVVVLLIAGVVGGGIILGGKHMRRQSAESMLVEAVELLKNEDKGKALHMLRSVVLSAPDNARARMEYAKGLGMTGRPGEAEEQLRKALELEPGSVEAMQNLGTLLFETGRTAEASEMFERALAGSSGNFMATYYLAAAQMREGRLEEAEAMAMKLVEMQPGMKVSESLLADILSLRGKNEDALRAYEDVGADSLREKLNTAITLHKDGRFKAAEKIYQEIIGNEQIIARAYNNLAWEMVQDGRATKDELMAAFNLAARAAMLNPADAQAADTLGWIMFLGGKHAEAEKILLKALELQPGMLDATMHLARIYIENDQNDRAEKTIREALSGANTEQDKAALNELLASLKK